MRGPAAVLSLDGEEVTRRRTFGDGGIVNEFDIPEHLRHPDYVTRGVAAEIFGKPNTQNLNQAYEAGWRPVKAKHFPGAFSDIESRDPEAIVQRDGIILMARHKSLEAEAIAEQHRDALSLRETQGEAFGNRQLPEGFDRGRRSGDGRFDASKMVKRTREASPAELRPKLDYALPDDED